jgi:hypothetical protein
MKIQNLPIVIRWDKFSVGSSFFIPCIDREGMERWVKQEARRLRLKVLCKQVVENGMYGLRVWRADPTIPSHSVSP